MRITYLHQYFCTPDMWGGTRSYEMARRLVAAGHQVSVVTSDMCPGPSTPRGWRVTQEAGICVHWIPVAYSNHMSYAERMRAFLRFAWSSTVRAERLPADVVFASSTPLTIAIPAICAARRQRVPMVFEVRDLWPEAAISVGALRNPLMIRAAKWLEVTAYHKAARVVALSPRLRDGVLKHGIDADKVSVIPNGCDLELFNVSASEGQRFRREHAWLGDRPMILYAGTIGKVNGVDFLVRVAELVAEQRPDLCFVVAGTGCEQQRVRDLAQSCGVLDKNFFLPGKFAKQEMPRIMSAADLTVSLCVPRPELALDAANKVFDAMAASRPIALNYGGRLSDVICSEQAGIRLDGDDVRASANAIIKAVSNRQWLRMAGLAAREVGKRHYDRDALAAQLEQVLLQATDRHEQVIQRRAAA